MMFQGFRIGTLFGFPIRVHLSFLVLLGAALLWMGGAGGVLFLVMVAGSVLVHELGHALLARRLGVPIAGIGLHVFGGAAEMVGLPRRPDDEIAIAAAGPAVSFALSGLSYVLAAITGVHVLAVLAGVNLALGAFNLLPVFPSDGGRILRAWLARRHGLVRATALAVGVGRVMCLVLGAIGLLTGSFQLVLVAAVLWMAGGAERLTARLRGDHGAWRGKQEPATPQRVQAEYLPRGATEWRPGDASLPGSRPRPAVFVWRR
jgi:Zn-dependent protease